MNMDCSVVKDLLPLYREELLSETSIDFVEKHLVECETCNKFYQDYIEQVEITKKADAKVQNRLIHSLKRMKYELIGLACGLTVVFVCLAGLIFWLFHQPQDMIQEHYENAQDYGLQHYCGIAQLSMFPAANQASDNIKEFYYDSNGSKLYQTYQIFLKCEYDPQDYEIEVNRLLQIYNEETGLSTVLSEEENALPCIYAMLFDEGFEYALLDYDNCVIYYIYLQGIDKRDLSFDDIYLPDDYGQKGLYMESERDPYSIYPKK